MSDYEDFLFDLYHAKLKWKAIESGYIQPLWNDTIQNHINALSNLSEDVLEIEAHIIASKTYFKDQIPMEDILKHVSFCLKGQKSLGNKSQFEMCLFNRLSRKTNEI